MTKGQYKEKLWEEYLLSRQFIDETQRGELKTLGLKFRDDVDFLYQLHTCMASGGGAMKDEKTSVEYALDGEHRSLKCGGLELYFKEEILKQLIADMIGIFEDILPLGSVVDLKKDYLQQKLSLAEVSHVRMVIIKRFLGGGSGCYYPYAASVYPLGMGGQAKNFCFASNLIERVVYPGYRDEAEDAFVYQMKHQLIVEEKRKSMGFATKDECRRMEELIRSRKAAL